MGYPAGSLPIHLAAQTYLGCVPQFELDDFYEAIARKTGEATDAPNDKDSLALLIAGSQGNVSLSEAIFRRGAGSSCSQYLVLIHK